MSIQSIRLEDIDWGFQNRIGFNHTVNQLIRLVSHRYVIVSHAHCGCVFHSVSRYYKELIEES